MLINFCHRQERNPGTPSGAQYSNHTHAHARAHTSQSLIKLIKRKVICNVSKIRSKMREFTAHSKKIN